MPYRLLSGLKEQEIVNNAIKDKSKVLPGKHQEKAELYMGNIGKAMIHLSIHVDTGEIKTWPFMKRTKNY